MDASAAGSIDSQNTLVPRVARPPRVGATDLNINGPVAGATRHPRGAVEPRTQGAAPRRPEVGMTTSSAEPQETTVATQSTSFGRGFGGRVRGGGSRAPHFSDNIDDWANMLRPTKTAHLPELLTKPIITPPGLLMPEDTDEGMSPNAVRVDPLAPGGIDFYPVPLANMESTPEKPDRIAEDVWKLVESLTLEEKVGQMTQVHIGMLIGSDGTLNRTAAEYWINKVKVGSIYDTPGNRGGKYAWYAPQTLANITNTIQELALAKGSRVPVLFGMDSVR
ncbi:hypothetical protein EC988_005546, partial [Linderina pennispora]